MANLRELVNKRLDALELPKEPRGLYDPVRYVLQGGGKRLRPLMLLTFVEAFGGDPLKALNQAIALEIYHNFTLLHDDVMDHAEIRHGRHTVHKKWNESTAILSGDVMITLASIYITKELDPVIAHKVAAVFNETALKIDEGQQYDMDFEIRDTVSLAEYEEMIMLKTGALFACAGTIAALLGSDSSQPGFNVLFKNVAKLCYLFGVAFQLQDDLLDTFGDEKRFGKAIGGDIVNNKKTWLSITLLKSPLKKKALEIMHDVNIAPGAKIKEITTLYNNLGLKEKLEKTIEGHLKKISSLLEEIDPWLVEGGRSKIETFINAIMGRDK